MPDIEEAVGPDPLTCPISEVDTFDGEFLQDPYPFYARTRTEAPVYRDPKSGVVYVATYDLVQEVNSKPRVFSNKFGERLRSGGVEPPSEEEIAIMSKGIVPMDTMLTADPPVHTRYRRLAMKAFTYKRVLQMTEYVGDLCHELIDAMPEDGCEFKANFAAKLPMYVISDALGVPREKFEEFESWSNAFIAQLSGVASKEQRLWAAERIIDFQTYFLDVIEQKRANPGDDVISDLVHADLAEEGDSRKMNHAELISILQQLLVAGNETTAHTLTAGISYLLQYPDQLMKLKNDPTLVPNLVEETLRYLSPTNNMWRVATSDDAIGGVDVSEGDLILLRYGSANRDESVFSDPDTFDISRANAKRHFAFGAGIHTCLGAQLARKEMVTAFPIILDRLSGLSLDSTKGDLQYLPSILMRGVVNLNISYVKRPRE
ncbi:MAG: cytochrome P450 [Pseudomonadota bacterium]